MQLQLHAQLTKVDVDKRLVYGIATAEKLDRSGEILDYASSKPNFEKWVKETMAASGGQSQGNLRAMHGKVAAGKLVKIEFDDANLQIPVVAKVVDDQEWKKVLEGVYTGFSIGGSYANKWDDPSMKKTDGKPAVRYTANPSELSLVDRACLPDAKFFSIEKADGSSQQMEFKLDETKPVEETKPADEPAKVDEPSKTNDAPAEKAEYAVDGNEEQVAELAKMMNDGKLSMADVIAAVKTSVEGKAAIAKADADIAQVLALEADGTLKKGMYTLCDLARAIASLQSIFSNVKYEKGNEGDDSKLPQVIAELLNSACDALQIMVIEEIAEIMNGTAMPEVMEMMAKYEGLKPLETLIKTMNPEMAVQGHVYQQDHSKRQKSLQKMHDSTVKMGAACAMPADKAHTHDGAPLAKADDLQKMVDAALAKVSEARMAEVDDLTKRLKKLEDSPAPSKIYLRAISKTDDVEALSKAQEEAARVEVAPVLNKDGDVNEVASGIKALHKSGGMRLT
jgi:hypothetical protein